MAVVKYTKAVALKVASNYGEQKGKIVKKTKTYGDVKPAATDEALYATYKHIKGLQEPIGEGCMRVTTDDLVENA